MSTESSTSKLILNANTSNSTSTTPTSSSPITVNGNDHHHHQQQQQQLNNNVNGILNDGKLTSTNYHNGVLSDLQNTYQGSSWSNVIDPLSGASGDHPFDVHNSGRMFSPQTTPPPPLMAMQQQQQQQVSYQQAIQRRPITASHNFSTQTIRNGISIPSTQTAPPINGRTAIPSPLWNSQSPLIGSQTTLSMPPPHIQQQQPPSPSWNTTSIPHGFPATSSRRPVPSLTNPMGNSNTINNNLNQTLILGNGNLPISQTKKISSSQNNFFPFLQSTTNQNKYNNHHNNIQTPLVSSLSNTHQRTPAMTNFIQTQNKQSPPPPPPHIINGNDMEPNFPSMNSNDAYDMSSLQQIMDMMRNVSSDGVKRVYSDDSGMGSILDTESLISAGGPSSSIGLFGSPRAIPIDMNKEERFSRKVFVGGLPPDIDEEEIIAHFQRFGPLIVDWPHKQESKSYFPPKGYAFLIFTYERSVQELIDECVIDDSKLYMCVSSPSMKDKAVQIRPWLLADSDFVMDGSQPLDPRKTIFVGGVPRPLRAVELAMIMDRLYGGVCYAGIDTDPELKYPKGAGRVAFSNQQSYIAAISARFVQLQHGDIDKRVEVKPYVLDDQLCDECAGARCGGKFAPFFCANVTCLQYYCETCWASIHARAGREYHKPLVKEGADRPRTLPFRW
ncbi:unnamed protein product [Rotaria sordida]|uniref:RRM domain-containing protein n=1 Tax=Rotaria sordida TaxID=392033 RepID=A0A818LI32_9BILA|nr:unnamed protein product [Rotaria sordida]CAF3576280.1 unnamed protein product [Rotaria sordida]